MSLLSSFSISTPESLSAVPASLIMSPSSLFSLFISGVVFHFSIIIFPIPRPASPISMAADSNSNLRIIVERNPPESRLAELNIKCWPKWGCSPGKYPLKFDAEETCYLLKGKVKAYAKGSSEFVEFGAGDLVTIPKGLSCTWDVSVAVDKHYKFESASSSSTSPF